MQFIAIDESCGYTAMAVRDIEPGEELFTFYSLDYFQDIKGGCPCRSCQPEEHELQEAEKQEQQINMRHQVERDKAIIEGKKKEQKKRRREKQKGKSKET